MLELNGFTKEERLIFGLDIIQLYRDKKKNPTKLQQKKFKIKLKALKKERDKFLKDLKK